jgi:hypothetical protein
MRHAATTAALAAGAALAGTTLIGPAVAGAAAKRSCSPIPANPNAPHILAPCNGTKLVPEKAVTFSVYDGDSQATATPPLILISASRTLTDGHLAAPPPLGGDFHSLTSDPADPTRFTYTSPMRLFPKWWENTAGTYYVQIRQTDTRAGTPGRFYSPITTVHVG